jgi:hypothetical protein
MQFAGGLIEHECPRCHRPVELPLGALCDVCRAEIQRRAARLGNLIALCTTLLLAGYIYWRMPRDPAARLVGGMAIGIWFLVSNMVVRRAVRELSR